MPIAWRRRDEIGGVPVPTGALPEVGLRSWRKGAGAEMQ
jgi:hypothetical protein